MTSGAPRSSILLSTDSLRLLDSGLIADPESARGRILLASSRLFGSKGFSATTVRDIAAEVGILSGSIFHHFHNKEEILFEVMSGIIRLALARLERDLGSARTLEEELQALIHCELQSVHDRSGAGFQVLGREWRHLTTGSQARILELRDRYNAVWLERIERAREQGLHGADSRLLRHFLRGAIVDTHTWFEPRGRVSLDEVEEELYRTFFADQRRGRSLERRPCSP